MTTNHKNQKRESAHLRLAAIIALLFMFSTAAVGSISALKDHRHLNSIESLLFGPRHLATKGQLGGGPPQQECFSTSSELFNAVRRYQAGGNTEQYGESIGDWCVGALTDFSEVFATLTFNEDISRWDVSNGVIFRSMFENTVGFNQDLSGWDVGNGQDFREMFKDSTSFNQDLCAWGTTIFSPTTADFRKIFANSDCDVKDDPGPDLIEGPYCTTCPEIF